MHYGRLDRDSIVRQSRRAAADFFNLPMMIICRRATDVLSVTNFFPEAQMVN